MKRLFLHICCAPCAIFPVECLKQEGFAVTGGFYNPNIHPSKEYILRKQSVEKLKNDYSIQVDFANYDIETFFKIIKDYGKERCYYCYKIRLEKTAKMAKERDFKFFSSSLLYSKMQNHEQIKKIAEDIANNNGLEFIYRDFRTGWKYAIEKSKEKGYYRQNYCGCVFSEKERFYR